MNDVLALDQFEVSLMDGQPISGRARRNNDWLPCAAGF
jgi:hypothetical protein